MSQPIAPAPAAADGTITGFRVYAWALAAVFFGIAFLRYRREGG